VRWASAGRLGKLGLTVDAARFGSARHGRVLGPPVAGRSMEAERTEPLTWCGPTKTLGAL
jgi:hypothetical protein